MIICRNYDLFNGNAKTNRAYFIGPSNKGLKICSKNMLENKVLLKRSNKQGYHCREWQNSECTSE